MSLPSTLVGDVVELKGTIDSGSPAIDQLALAILLSSGAYERHVVRARNMYRRRRDRLASALSMHLPGMRIEGAAAGMQVLLRLPDDVDDCAVAQRAVDCGVGVRPLSPMHLVPSRERGLLLGFGRLVEPSVDDAVRVLASILVEAVAPRGVASAGCR